MCEADHPETREVNPSLTSQESKRGIIWKIDRFATHDGPGIRTALYFKGCPLKCRWCSNPEGQSQTPVLVFRQTACSGCGLCTKVCPVDALEIRKGTGKTDANVEIDRSRCNSCGVCEPACPTGALQIWGKHCSVPELVEILEKDRFIHKRSGGGVTCTGGEPLLQREFVQDFLEACHKRGIHTAAETCAYADEEPFKAFLKQVDWLFIDLKHMDAKAHLALTGKSNDLILNNVRVASKVLMAAKKALVIRMVLVSGINDDQNVSDFAAFVRSLPFVTMVELLPYHNYGEYKYDLLGRSYPLPEARLPTPEAMEKYRKLLENQGLAVA